MRGLGVYEDTGLAGPLCTEGIMHRTHRNILISFKIRREKLKTFRVKENVLIWGLDSICLYANVAIKYNYGGSGPGRQECRGHRRRGGTEENEGSGIRKSTPGSPTRWPCECKRRAGALAHSVLHPSPLEQGLAHSRDSVLFERVSSSEMSRRFPVL